MFRRPSTRYNKQPKRTAMQWREYFKEKYPIERPTKPTQP